MQWVRLRWHIFPPQQTHTPHLSSNSKSFVYVRIIEWKRSPLDCRGAEPFKHYRGGVGGPGEVGGALPTPQEKTRRLSYSSNPKVFGSTPSSIAASISSKRLPCAAGS